MTQFEFRSGTQRLAQGREGKPCLAVRAERAPSFWGGPRISTMITFGPSHAAGHDGPELLAGLSDLVESRGPVLAAVVTGPGEPGRAIQEVVDSSIVSNPSRVYGDVTIAGNAKNAC